MRVQCGGGNCRRSAAPASPASDIAIIARCCMPPESCGQAQPPGRCRSGSTGAAAQCSARCGSVAAQPPACKRSDLADLAAGRASPDPGRRRLLEVSGRLRRPALCRSCSAAARSSSRPQQPASPLARTWQPQAAATRRTASAVMDSAAAGSPPGTRPSRPRQRRPAATRRRATLAPPMSTASPLHRSTAPAPVPPAGARRHRKRSLDIRNTTPRKLRRREVLNASAPASVILRSPAPATVQGGQPIAHRGLQVAAAARCWRRQAQAFRKLSARPRRPGIANATDSVASDQHRLKRKWGKHVHRQDAAEAQPAAPRRFDDSGRRARSAPCRFCALWRARRRASASRLSCQHHAQQLRRRAASCDDGQKGSPRAGSAAGPPCGWIEPVDVRPSQVAGQRAQRAASATPPPARWPGRPHTPARHALLPCRWCGSATSRPSASEPTR